MSTQPLIINNEFQNDFNVTLDIDTDSIANAIEKTGIQINIDTQQLANIFKNQDLKLNIGIDLSKYENVFNNNVNFLFQILIILFVILISLCIIKEIIKIFKNITKKQVVNNHHINIV